MSQFFNVIRHSIAKTANIEILGLEEGLIEDMSVEVVNSAIGETRKLIP